MAKVISHRMINESTTITECSDGWWLYDENRGMNLSMKAKSEVEALIEALESYQDRLKKINSDYEDLESIVDVFVYQFIKEDEYNDF